MSTSRWLRMHKVLLTCFVCLTLIHNHLGLNWAQPIEPNVEERDSNMQAARSEQQKFLHQLWPASSVDGNQSAVLDCLGGSTLQELEMDPDMLDSMEPATSSSRPLARRQAIHQPPMEASGQEADYEAYRGISSTVDFGNPSSSSALLLADDSLTLAGQKLSPPEGPSSIQPQHQTQLQQQDQQLKIGPQFIREPPGYIHYLNSSDLVIPCTASGNPPPTVVSNIEKLLPASAGLRRVEGYIYCFKLFAGLLHLGGSLLKEWISERLPESAVVVLLKPENHPLTSLSILLSLSPSAPFWLKTLSPSDCD